MLRGGLLALFLTGCASQNVTPEMPRNENEPPPRTVVSLRLGDLSGDAPPPRSSLELVLVHDHAEREIRSVGEIVGICTPDAAPAAGLLASIRCWWQGEESTYSARRFGNAVQVRRDDEVLLEAAIPEDVETHSLRD